MTVVIDWHLLADVVMLMYEALAHKYAHSCTLSQDQSWFIVCLHHGNSVGIQTITSSSRHGLHVLSQPVY